MAVSHNSLRIAIASSRHGTRVYFADDAPFVLAEPYGSPGQNALSELGFNYRVITHLQDGGLVQSDFSAYKDIVTMLFALPVEVGGTVMSFTVPEQFPRESLQDTKRVMVINFTTAGTQLRQIVDKTPNEKYIEKFRSWVSSTYGFQAL